MPDFNVRLRVTLTGWHDWEPFGLSPDPPVPASFGIEVFYMNDDAIAQLLALDTMATTSHTLSMELQQALHLVYDTARIEASKRLNEMPYQLSAF